MQLPAEFPKGIEGGGIRRAEADTLVLQWEREECPLEHSLLTKICMSKNVSHFAALVIDP